MKVVVLTTSYPRSAGDAAGRFVADAVQHLRARGVDVEVVSPASFRHFGIAYGAGVAGNLRHGRGWHLRLRSCSCPSPAPPAAPRATPTSCTRTGCRPPLVALATRRPVVLTVHGTDLELARRARPLARALLRRVRVVLAVSTALAEEARALGARDVRVVPNGVEVPAQVGAEAEPPEILFAGRLSPEKGILELVEAAQGHTLVVAGDGPLRPQVPQARGWLAHDELERLYARAAVVACPSHREGFGLACAEAMAARARSRGLGRRRPARSRRRRRDRPARAATRRRRALRAAIERLVGDPELRRRLGTRGRERVRELCAWSRVTDATVAAYEEACRRG